jgi:hypothetical protein
LYVSRENGGVTLQKNFNAGELRYIRNVPGGRRQRASAAATSELTSGLLRTLSPVHTESLLSYLSLENSIEQANISSLPWIP